MNAPVAKFLPAHRSQSGKGGALWKWGFGGAVAAAAAGAIVFNREQARQADRTNPPLGTFVELDGIRLHYLVRGTGPLVVLLHGNGTMIEDWIASGVLDDLASTHRVIAFDRPGFGHSDRSRTRLWTPAAQARLIAKALALWDEKHVMVVGHSFGTMVALELAATAPGLVTSLVLIGGYYYPSVRADVPLAAPPALPLVGDAIRYTVSPLIGAALRGRMEAKIFAPASVSAGWRDDFPFEMTLRPSQIRAAAAEAAMMVPAAAPLAALSEGLSIPVTIVAGAGDKVVDTTAQSVRLASAIPRSKLLVVEDAGHMVHHTAAGDVARAIRAATL